MEEDSKKCTHQANLRCYTRLPPLISYDNLQTKSSNTALHWKLFSPFTPLLNVNASLCFSLEVLSQAGTWLGYSKMQALFVGEKPSRTEEISRVTQVFVAMSCSDMPKAVCYKVAGPELWQNGQLSLAHWEPGREYWREGKGSEKWRGGKLQGRGRKVDNEWYSFVDLKPAKIFQNLRDTNSLDPIAALSKQLQQPFGKQSHLAQPSPSHGWQCPGATSPCINSVTPGAQLGYSVIFFVVLFRNLMNLCLKKMLFQTKIQRK